MVASAAFLFSCNTKTGQKSPDSLTVEQARQDSIEDSQIKGYEIKLLEGENKNNGITNIEYQSLSQLIEEENKKAVKEMTKKEDLNFLILSYKTTSMGGAISLHIDRETIGMANTKWFSIIVKDKNEKEMYRKALDESVPYSNAVKTWSNITICSVNQKIKTPFFVYVIDKFADKPFKFEVTTMK